MALAEPVSNMIEIVGDNAGLFIVIALSLAIIFYSLFVMGYMLFNYKKMGNKRMALILVILTEVIAVAELQLLIKILSTSNYLGFDLVIHVLNATAMIYSFLVLNKNEGITQLLDIGQKNNKEEPASETLGKKKKIAEGYVYLINEKKPLKAFEIFRKKTGQGKQGLAITKEIPERIRKDYKINEEIPVMELSANFTRKTRIEDIISKITKFIEDTNKDGILVIDCLDRIMTSIDFNTLLKIVQILKTQSIKNNSIIIISINPEIFEQKQLALIEQETEVLTEKTEEKTKGD